MPNTVEIIVRAKDLASGTLDRIGAKTEEAGAKFGPLGKVGGIALAGIGLAAAAVAAESVKMASTFQSTMEQLATQAHVPQKSVDDLSQRVLDLAGKVGEGPDSLAEALYHIESSFASTGITGGKAMHLLETASKGAKMGHADLVDVTNALDAAVVSGIPGVKDFDQAMGMLNATVGSGDMHMQDLADAFSTGAVAVVKNYGLSLRDVGAALAVFGDNNIRGRLAGTQLRMTVQSLAVPAKTGAKALEELGLKSDTLAKDMQHGGLIEAVSDLHEHLVKSGNTGVKSGNLLTQAFGKKAGVGLAMLVDQFDRLKSKYVEIDKGANGFADAWKQQQATFAQQWDQVKASVEGVMIKLGLKLLPMLSKALPVAGAIAVGAINGLSDAIDATQQVLDPLIGFIQDHSTVFGAFAVAIAAGAAAWAIWTGAIAAWTVVTGIATAAQAAFDAVLDANPIMLIIIAIAALAAGLIYAYKHSEAFRNIVDDVAGAISNAAKAVWNFEISIVQAVATAVAFVIDRFGDMATFVGNVLSHIPGMGAAGAALQTLGRQAHAAAEKVRNVARALEGIKSKDVNLTVRHVDLFSTKRIGGPGIGPGPWAKATGGIVGRAAGGGPRSNTTLVGENGPELVDLAPGSTVHSAPDSERMLSGGGTPRVVLEIKSSGSSMDDWLLQQLRKSIRVKGGNVQLVLGT
jgi:TP901 family phage tail tape measure protein